MKKPIFKGVCVALITPFKNGKIDYKGMGELIDYQIKNGISAISILGTTGEPCVLSYEEKQDIIRFCVEKIGHRAKLIVGTGGNNTSQVVKISSFASENDIDGLLAVTPYYNKCTQNGLVKYYQAISDNSDKPIIVYNVPSRTGLNVLPSTLDKIINIERIVGFKQASSNIQEILEICRKFKESISIYSGEDALNYIFYTLGADGCISVTANALPHKVNEVYNLFCQGNLNSALTKQEQLANINQLLFSEVNPIPIKCALFKLGLIENELREPLTPMENPNELINELKKLL